MFCSSACVLNVKIYVFGGCTSRDLTCYPGSYTEEGAISME